MKRISVPGASSRRLQHASQLVQRGRPPLLRRWGAAPPAAMALRCCSALLALSTAAAFVFATLALEARRGGDRGGRGPPLGRYQLTPAGRVESAYGVSEGYWRLQVNHTFPDPGIVSRARLRRGAGGGNASCWDLALAHEEPYSDFYRPRGVPPQVGTRRTTSWKIALLTPLRGGCGPEPNTGIVSNTVCQTRSSAFPHSVHPLCT